MDFYVIHVKHEGGGGDLIIVPLFDLFLGTQATKIWPDLEKRGGKTVEILTQSVITGKFGGGTVLATSLIQTKRTHVSKSQEIMSLPQTTSGVLQQLLCFPCHL